MCALSLLLTTALPYAHAGPSQIAEAQERGLLSDGEEEGCQRDELPAPVSPDLMCTFATPPESDGAPRNTESG